MPTLNHAIAAAGGNSARMMYRSQGGRYAFPIPAEFTHWAEEQRAWRESVALMDQSFHMTDLYLSGPDTVRLLKHLAVNSFEGFGRNKAKQIVCCNADGFVIGDAILFGLEDDQVSIVGRPVLASWVQYHALTGGWDLAVDRDQRSLDAPDAPRRVYRYEVQGPRALDLLAAVNQGGPLTTKFFNMGEIVIDGCRARTLSHGMGGAPGLEIFGPFAEGPRVKAALIEAGRAFGLRQIGARAYASAAPESGWVPSPMPAIFSGPGMEAYRDWLSDRSFEATSTLGGSFVSDRIEDYYFTPWDLDYGRVVKFDHAFVGRAALERMAPGPHRQKVTLVWDAADVARVFAELQRPGDLAPKILEMPASHYAAYPYDRVLAAGQAAGVSITPAYSANERAWISLAVLDPGAAVPGTTVDVVWGEPDGGSGKPAVERHRQVTIRATVHPWPIHEAARARYRRQT